jgi:hypothetical protein
MSAYSQIYVDFTGVEEEERRKEEEPPPCIPEGWYEVEVESVEHRLSTVHERPYLFWSLKFDPPVHPKFRVHMATSLQEQGLWRLRDLIWAVSGVKPTGLVQFTPIHFVGKRLLVQLQMDSYQGVGRNKVGRMMRSMP